MFSHAESTCEAPHHLAWALGADLAAGSSLHEQTTDMARKRSPEPPTPDPELLVPHDEADRRLAERIERGREIVDREFRSVENIDAAKDEYRKWSDFNAELLRRLFTTPKFAEEYTWWGVASVRMYPPSPQEKLEELQKDVADKLRRLESIKERLELIPLASGVVKPARHATRSHTNRAFIVHGHDEAARETVARFLERLGIEAVILHEQATSGRTIIEKLEHYSDVDFAVVLLTPDDVGAKSGESDQLQARARQNVILELGFFVGKLGRSHVCALYRGSLELPTDYLGVGYVPLDSGGGWRLQLAKELRSAGFAVDMNLAL